jgi:DNA-binding NtrC family response regulator
MNAYIDEPKALLQGYKLVLIEDDPLLQSILSGFVEDLGGTVSSFDTADDALVHMLGTKERASLVVTDHLVPGQIKGAELVLMVKTRWPDMPVIITTGFGSEIAPDLPNGVLYMQKPWNLDEMKTSIIRMLQTFSPDPALTNSGLTS